MNLLSDILARLPEISQSRMVNSGYGIWVCWADKLNTAIPQTLSDHGGLKLAEDNKQALWFFLSNEAFRAVARLLIWARLNPMPVFIEILPAMLLVDYRLNISLSIPPELSNQRSHTPTEFEVLVHPSMKQHVNAIPGLSLIEEGEVAGLGSIAWEKFRADQGLDYESTLKWYGIIRPLGNPADRKFIVGWRSFYNEIQTVLQRLGCKYMGKDEFTIFQVESLRLLRSFCREINLLCRRVKEDKAEGEEESTHYWPAVFACVLQQGLNFNEELPKKVNLDWNKLSPDFPHLRYRSAFLLGEGFRLNDVGYGSSQETVDSWCNVSFVGEGGEMEEEGSLDVFMPRKLFTGENSECLYCGMKNHSESVCPTRQIPNWDANVWALLAKMDIEEINEGFKELEQELDSENMAKSLEERLEGEDKQSVLTRAVFEINAPSQIRLMKLVWRSRGKDWPDGFGQLSPEGGEYLWSALDIIISGDLDLAEESLRQASLKYTRSYQPRSLQGIVSLEKADPDQALFFWQEAERLSYTPLQQGYFLYLQGRLHEVQGEFKEAIELYQKAKDVSPKWIDPGYRKAVCMVKRGFSEQAVHDFQSLIEKDPNIFNRMLVDPELERGRLHLMGALWHLWLEAETLAKEERKNLEKLTMDVGQWFEDSHDFHEVAERHINRLTQLAKINNFVAFKELNRGRNRLTSEIERRVDNEIKQIDAKVDWLFERLKDVQKEASWFPFPKLLHEFNQDFNYCAEKLNWIKVQHLKVAENFRRTQRYLTEVDARIKTLQGRLVTLRIVRDSTLFILMLGRNFIWIELLCLGLALVSIPGFIYFTKGMEGNWLVDLVTKQRWEFQKGLVIIMSIFALVAAALKSALGFEKRKRKLFERDEAEEKSEKEERQRIRRQEAIARAKRRRKAEQDESPKEKSKQPSVLS